MLKGDYAAALDIYRTLKRLTGGVAWDWDIRVLERRLEIERTVFFNQELGSILSDVAGIEHIYVANLIHRGDRKTRMTTELLKFGIHLADVSFIEAVHGATNAKALQLYENFRVADPRNYESISRLPIDVLNHDRAKSSVGVIGYLLSQEKIIKDALQKKYKKILIFDDDVFFSGEASALANNFFNKVKEWKIVHLGASEHSTVNDDIWQKKLDQANSCGFYNPNPYKTCGSFAVAYDSSVLEQLRILVGEYVGVFDRAILSYFYINYPGQCFALRPAVCCADVSESDIRESRHMSEHALKMGWDISRYAEYLSAGVKKSMPEVLGANGDTKSTGD